MRDKKSKKCFIFAAAFICIMFAIVARHQPPSRRKIKELWHGGVYWERESKQTMMHSSLENIDSQTVMETPKEITTTTTTPVITVGTSVQTSVDTVNELRSSHNVLQLVKPSHNCTHIVKHHRCDNTYSFNNDNTFVFHNKVNVLTVPASLFLTR